MIKRHLYKLKIATLLLFVFSLGFEYWDPLGIRHFFTVTKFTALLYFLLSFLDIKNNFALRKKDRIIILSAFGYWFTLFIISLISTIFYPGIDIDFHMPILQLVFLFWLIYNDLNRQPTLRVKLLLSFIIGIGFVSVLTSLGIGLGIGSGEELYEGARLYFFGMNPNTVGNLTALVLFGVISIVFAPKNIYGKWKYLLLLLVPNLLMLIGMSGSRGALVMVFAGFTVLFLFRKTNVFNKIITILIGIFILSFLYDYFLQFDTIQGRLGSNVQSIGGRTGIWKAAIDIFYNSPLFGVGSGYNHEMTLRYGEAKSTHNFFLFVLTRTGIIGLSFVLIYHLRILKNAFNNYRITNNVQDLIFFLIIILILSKSGGIETAKYIWLFYAIIGANVKNNIEGK